MKPFISFVCNQHKVVKKFFSPFHLFTLLLFPLFFSSCSEEEKTYSDFHPNLTIDNATHLDATLATAMDIASPGVWCHISTTMRGGAYYFIFNNNQGLTSESIFNAIDSRQESQRHVGMYNGIIIGFSIFGDGFYAYDAQCPDCFDYLSLPLRNYPLTLSGIGKATCNHCGRTFDLSQWPNGLTRYHATTSGPFGLLRVF